MQQVYQALLGQAAGNSVLLVDRSDHVRTCDHDVTLRRYDVLRTYRDYPNSREVAIIVQTDDVELLQRAVSADHLSIAGVYSFSEKRILGPRVFDFIASRNEKYYAISLILSIFKYRRLDLLQTVPEYVKLRTACRLMEILDSPMLREFLYSFRHLWHWGNDKKADCVLSEEQLNFLLKCGATLDSFSYASLTAAGHFEWIENMNWHSVNLFGFFSKLPKLGLEAVKEVVLRTEVSGYHRTVLIRNIVHYRQLDAIPWLLTVDERKQEIIEWFFTGPKYYWDIEVLEIMTAGFSELDLKSLACCQLCVVDEAAANWCLRRLGSKNLRLASEFENLRWKIQHNLLDFAKPLNLRSCSNAELSWLLANGVRIESYRVY